MKNVVDYSKYKCPYSYIDIGLSHSLHGPNTFKQINWVWCLCGFRGPIMCLDPEELKLELKGGKKDGKKILSECNKNIDACYGKKCEDAKRCRDNEFIYMIGDL
jgi:hypothetical protein